MGSVAIDMIFSPRRRGWILLTAILATVLFSWASVSHLSELVDVQQLPTDPTSHSIFELAEQNIASHLHLGGLAATDTSSQQLSSRGSQTSSQTNQASATATAGNKQKIDASLVGQQAPDKKPLTTKGSTSFKQKPATDDKGKAAASTAAQSASCKDVVILNNTDFWGEALVWGSDNKAKSAQDCCAKCAAYKPKKAEDADCNVWVFCGDRAKCETKFGECWLKHLPHPHGTGPAKDGPEVAWTTGIMEPIPTAADVAASSETIEERRYHVVISAQGAATHWQSRVHYYWYKKIKAQCEAAGGCQMGGFTRLLHSGEPDDLMDEIPTFVAQTLPPEHPDHGYIVLNRPWAFTQWVQAVDIPEKYVLMSEPDHIWLKPMPNIMVGRRPAAFPFFYIEPSKKEYLPIVQKFLGPITRVESEEIAPIGSAPTMMALDDLKLVAPLWFNLSIAVHNDPEASKEWGWVQEMYAFTLASYKAGVRNTGLHLKLMSQPPFDDKMEPFYILHYTYGMDYTLEGVFTPGKYGEWRFDKRSYSSKPPPRNLIEPPAGMKNELVRHLIHALNEATEAIPGWDQYEATGVATEVWDGVL